MRRHFCKTTALALAIVVLMGRTAAPPNASAGPDEGEAAARALLERAIQAVGGAGPLAKSQAVTAQVEAAFHYPGRDLALRFSSSVQGFDRFRIELEALQQNPLTVTLVVNGKDRWAKAPANSRFGAKVDILKEMLFQGGLLDDLYALQLAQLLLPLRDKAFQLSPTGEITVGTRPALGFRVSHAGRPDVNIYLDKKSSLPVKCELRVRAAKTNEEFTHDLLLQEYKVVDGIKHFTKLTVERDNTKFFSAELTDIEHQEKLEARTFAQP